MAVGLMVGSMAFSISGGNPCWQQCAAFVAGSCIYSRHCAVNGIKVGKIIRSLRLPQFAVRHYGADYIPIIVDGGRNSDMPQFNDFEIDLDKKEITVMKQLTETRAAGRRARS